MTQQLGFPAYLQGMETRIEQQGWIQYPVRSQPTYKEWKLKAEARRPWSPFVPSLPTRNGNDFQVPRPGHKVSPVPSLPTRNGNGGTASAITWATTFPAYLQGMETFD